MINDSYSIKGFRIPLASLWVGQMLPDFAQNEFI